MVPAPKSFAIPPLLPLFSSAFSRFAVQRRFFRGAYVGFSRQTVPLVRNSFPSFSSLFFSTLPKEGCFRMGPLFFAEEAPLFLVGAMLFCSFGEIRVEPHSKLLCRFSPTTQKSPPLPTAVVVGAAALPGSYERTRAPDCDK